MTRPKIGVLTTPKMPTAGYRTTPMATRARYRGQAPAEMSFRLMDAERASYPVAAIARVLGVSTSGYYDWKHRGSGLRPGLRVIGS